MAEFKDQTGTPVLPTVDAEGNVPVGGEVLLLLQEQNRLLRRLIAGLELYLGQEFPEVE